MPETMLRISIFICLCITSIACTADSSVSADFIDGINLTITSKNFDEKKHKIKKCKYAVCAIDDKFIYGNNGAIPKQEATSLVFIRNGKKVNLNVSSMYDVEITNENIKNRFNVQRYLGKNSYRIIGYFGKDAEEPYIGHWLVVGDNSSVRNHLSDYESLVSLIFEVKKDHNIPQ